MVRGMGEGVPKGGPSLERCFIPPGACKPRPGGQSILPWPYKRCRSGAPANGRRCRPTCPAWHPATGPHTALRDGSFQSHFKCLVKSSVREG
jgi:hypothetical protein